jgi:hypothetical protein
MVVDRPCTRRKIGQDDQMSPIDLAHEDGDGVAHEPHLAEGMVK